nr:MAG TPA: hypothetical protein [Caudoviricetes sp.]
MHPRKRSARRYFHSRYLSAALLELPRSRNARSS